MTVPINPEAFETARVVVAPPPGFHQAPRARRSTKRKNAARFLKFWRVPLRDFSFARLMRGGRLSDLGRLPRHAFVALLSLLAVWTPIALYVAYAPLRYSSDVAMILPGAGVSSSVNLSDIGQASSSANSAYSSSSLSPTVTYRSLLQSGQVAQRAGETLGLTANEIGAPRVKLLDQTSLIRLTITGPTPSDARARADAILQAFLVELATLRNDEIARRQASTDGPIQQYKERVETIRDEISLLQSQSGLTSAAQYASIVETNETLHASVAKNRSALEATRQTVQSLVTLLQVTPSEASLALRLHADIEFAALASTTAKAAAKLAEASRQYGPKHPKVISARAQLQGARNQMHRIAGRLTGLSKDKLMFLMDISADGERAALLTKLVSLVSEMKGQEAQLQAQQAEWQQGSERVRELVDTASRLDSLNRDYKVAEAVFASALARMDSSKSDIFASYPMVQVIEPASLPLEASSPNRLVAVAAGIAATLCLLFAHLLAWIRRPLIDRLLRRPEEIHAADAA